MDFNDEIGKLMDHFTPGQDYQLVHKQMNSTLFHFIALQHDLSIRAQTLKSSLANYKDILQDIRKKGSKTQIVVTPSSDGSGSPFADAPQAKLSTYRYDAHSENGGNFTHRPKEKEKENAMTNTPTTTTTPSGLVESSASEEEGEIKLNSGVISAPASPEEIVKNKNTEEIESIGDLTDGRKPTRAEIKRRHNYNKEHVDVAPVSSSSLASSGTSERGKILTRSAGFKRSPSPDRTGGSATGSRVDRRATASGPGLHNDDSEEDPKRKPFKISNPSNISITRSNTSNNSTNNKEILLSPNPGARRDWEWDEDDDGESRVHLSTSDFCDLTAGLKNVYRAFQNISKVSLLSFEGNPKILRNTKRPLVTLLSLRR